MKLMTFGAAWLIAVSTSAALAADATSAAQPAGAFVWTGGYAGVQAGHLWGSGRTTAATGWNSEPGVDGWLGGVYAGYNHQLANQVVIGVEADLTVGNADGFGQRMIPSVSRFRHPRSATCMSSTGPARRA